MSQKTYKKAVIQAKRQLGYNERMIFEDHDGNFHVIANIDNETYRHYANVNKWTPRGRVFTEITVNDYQ